ncbi:MAG TPA: SBBP repeat-containing protein [Terriglobia bacterium]|jgi:hypothetical protein|nr:SBBP repeat-containing protein [Terriglobia bacterium]
MTLWQRGLNAPVREGPGFGRLTTSVAFLLALIFSIGNFSVRGLAQTPAIRSDDAARQSTPPASAGSVDAARFRAQYGQLPLSFEANQGQADSQVKFLSRGAGYTLLLTADEAVLALKTEGGSTQRISGRAPKSERRTAAALRMKLAGANLASAVTGLDALPGKSNYFLGNDPTKWRSNVTNYSRVKFADVYPGIDLVYYGNQGHLEYDFAVAPGADPGIIALDVAGSGPARIDRKTGDLLVGSAIRLHKPVIYQPVLANLSGAASGRRIVEGHYTISARGRVAFKVARYDRTKPLVIDPALSYSSFFGGSSDDTGRAMAVDSTGNLYLTGSTCSTNLPVLDGFQQTYGGASGTCSVTNGGDAFVAKFNPTLTTLLYSTYLGGTGNDVGDGIAVDSSGDAYVTGATCSGTTFPTTTGAYQRVYGGGVSPCTQDLGDAFVTEVNPTGSALVYSTFLGGSNADTGNAISLDRSNNAYVLGTTCSTNFPTTTGAFQITFAGDNGACGDPPDGDAFVTELNSTGTALLYSTYVGGSAPDTGYGLALDSNDDAFITGRTFSNNFPTTPGAFDTTCNACTKSLDEAFVTELNPTGTALVYSTYLGGSSGKEPCAACATAIAVDGSGDAYVTGLTSDSTDFPLMNPYQPVYGGGGHDVFLTKFNSTGSALVYSTFLGGTGDDGATAVAVDPAGNAYVRGNAASPNFPTTAGAFQTVCGGGCSTNDHAIFWTEFNPAGSALLYSTFVGGSMNGFGKATRNLILGTATSPAIYITGYTNSTDYPVTTNAYQHAEAGGYDAPITEFIPGSNVTAKPAAITFGKQMVGTQSGIQKITLTNMGYIALTVASITISGPDKGDFSQTNTCGSSVPARTACTISVTFKPLATGERTAGVAMTDNGGGSPQQTTLAGFGTQ